MCRLPRNVIAKNKFYVLPIFPWQYQKQPALPVMPWHYISDIAVEIYTLSFSGHFCLIELCYILVHVIFSMYVITLYVAQSDHIKRSYRIKYIKINLMQDLKACFHLVY